MVRDPYDVAIDQILEGADGDVRLALRTMLVQRLELEATLVQLAEQLADGTKQPIHPNESLN